MQKAWLAKAMAYGELNPVKAGLVENAWDYRWSSVHAHLSGYDENGLVEVNKMKTLFGDWKNYLLDAQGLPMEEIESHNKTGRSLGNNRFLKEAEKSTSRKLIKKNLDQNQKSLIKLRVPIIPDNSPESTETDILAFSSCVIINFASYSIKRQYTRSNYLALREIWGHET
jgi:hypothetical protein